MKFPSTPNVVYVILVLVDGLYIPFYVGKSTRHIGRIGDYVSAQFSAPTDFKVGEAIRYLRDLNRPVYVAFRTSEDAGREEETITGNLRKQGHKLLNDSRGYNYKTADIASERKRIRVFVDGVIRNYPSPSQAR